jgi:hypothetical protein
MTKEALDLFYAGHTLTLPSPRRRLYEPEALRLIFGHN